MNTDTLKKPYGVYDVLGYLIPGGVLVLGVALFVWLMQGTVPSLQVWYSNTKSIWLDQWYAFITLVIVLLLTLYVIGHIIALLSAMFIDSFLIRRVHGYPFATMFQDKLPMSRFEWYKRLLSTGAHAFFLLAMVLLVLPNVETSFVHYTLGVCVWLAFVRLSFACYPTGAASKVHSVFLLGRFLVFAVLCLITAFWGYIWLAKHLHPTFRPAFDQTWNFIAGLWAMTQEFRGWGFICFSVSIVFGLIMLSGRLTKKSIGWRKAFKNQFGDFKALFKAGHEKDVLAATNEKPLSLLQYALMVLAALPAFVGYVVYYTLVRPWYAVTAIYRPMDKSFVDMFCKCCRKVFHPENSPESCKVCHHHADLYWLTACYLTENTERHHLNIKHWLNLYGFARNLGMAFFLLFLLGAVTKRNIGAQQMSPIVEWWPLATGILCVLLLHRYVYLYYKYYSKYIARAFVAEVLTKEFLAAPTSPTTLVPNVPA